MGPVKADLHAVFAFYTTLTTLSMINLTMCKVYTDIGLINFETIGVHDKAHELLPFTGGQTMIYNTLEWPHHV